MIKVFINGQAGTTGLRIKDRLSKRDDIELLVIDDDKRKNADEVKKYINALDKFIKKAMGLIDKYHVDSKIYYF